MNVLLGMGISWTIGAAYWAHSGVTEDPRLATSAEVLEYSILLLGLTLQGRVAK